MSGAVVAPAEQSEVVETGGAAVCPVVDVVGIAPLRRGAVSRVALPMSSGCEPPPVMMRDTLASQANRRAASDVITPVEPNSHVCPARPSRLSRSRVTVT